MKIKGAGVLAVASALAIASPAFASAQVEGRLDYPADFFAAAQPTTAPSRMATNRY